MKMGYGAPKRPLLLNKEAMHLYLNAVRVLWYMHENKKLSEKCIPFCFVEKDIELSTLVLGKPRHLTYYLEIDLITLKSADEGLYLRLSSKIAENPNKDRGQVLYRAGLKVTTESEEHPHLLDLDSYPIYDKFTSEKCIEYLNEKALSGFASEILCSRDSSESFSAPR